MAIDDEGRARVMRIVENLLERQIGAIDAVRALKPFLQLDPTLVSRDDRKALMRIASETEELPLGNVREIWHPDLLAEKDQEIERYERVLGDTVRSICERFVSRQQPSNAKYVGLPDFHYGKVRSVTHDNGVAQVTVEGESGRQYLVSFAGMVSVEMSAPKDMKIYALSETPSDVEGVRIFDFINLLGVDPDQPKSRPYLRVFATDFVVKPI